LALEQQDTYQGTLDIISWALLFHYVFQDGSRQKQQAKQLDWKSQKLQLKTAAVIQSFMIIAGISLKCSKTHNVQAWLVDEPFCKEDGRNSASGPGSHSWLVLCILILHNTKLCSVTSLTWHALHYGL